MSTFNYEKDVDGIVTVTMNMTGPVNAMNAEYRKEMGETVKRLEQEAKDGGLKGVVLASAKSTFFAGGDLNEILALKPGDEVEFNANIELTKGQLRRLEKLPVPVVAAINGAALGGGFEITLACNYRVALNTPGTVVGFPEVTLGLLPGAGGIVRSVNMLGLEKALPLLLEGTKLKPADALKAGVINELVEKPEDLIPAAKAWIKANPAAHEQPWDRKGHKIPGGTMPAPHLAQIVLMSTVAINKKTRGLLPAPERILSVATEAVTIDFDAALKNETRGLTLLAMSPQAKNIISTMFFQMNEINGGSSRPKGIEKSKVKKLGILGAGMMGQGIAYVSAMVGIEVVLRDISLEAAQKGKAYSEKLLQKMVEKGRMDEAKMKGILALITPTADAADLKGCDLIVEAVFENVELKAKVTKETEGYLAEGGVYGTNTSTLPITLLAKAAVHPDNFIGIHFFSPVDKMPLVEIICGEKTSDTALARAFDFARQIGKTPIIVNDSLGFFTSRTFSTYFDEGCRLLLEGVNPVLIDNMGRQAGMPVGPLTVLDEVSLELMRKVFATQLEMGVLHSKTDTRAAVQVCETMINQYGRGGRHYKGGFYEYSAEGEKTIWPKLYELYVKPGVSIPNEDIKDRLLFRQVIEAVKCLEEGVLRSVADGNIGSILGIGAPTWTGGLIQVINTYGPKRFVQRANELAKRYGDHLKPPALLVKKAEAGELFR